MTVFRKQAFNLCLSQSHMEAVISYIRGVTRGQFKADVVKHGEGRKGQTERDWLLRK